MNQTTLREAVVLEDVGVHSGKPARLTLHPAEANTGYTFLRTGLENGRERLISARHTAVLATELQTVISDGNGASIATIEHCLSALAGLGVDNALIEIDGPEVPILDGSSARFVDAIDQAGIVQLSRQRKVLKVVKKTRVEMGAAWAELTPGNGFRLDVEIDFKNPMIGRQRRVVDMSPAVYRRDISRARTFGFMRDVEKLWKAGFARGASLENTIAVDEDRIVNPEGLRYRDEFVRHKVLDAVGDLSLAGSAIQGTYKAYMPGHKLNFKMLEALFSDRSAYTVSETNTRREYGQAEVLVSSAAYGPKMS
ncbi:MAG: UDP-3-O-acyl-N-acetylglucosamine deacetylase [Beijerinckiaceae bacterium]|nr:UDP-3-O-acyl-N-acetylglucosamine deacetylase [Beijerinckiaceae bacterium]